MRVFRLALLLLAAALAGPAVAQNVANGQSLYMGICRACHGFPPSGGPDRAGGNPALIQNAINGRVPAMGFLRGILGNQDIADIAAWLLNPAGDPPPPPPPPPPAQPAVPAFDFTDLWWNPAESGWGLNLIQHPTHVIFGVMYTYDVNRRAAWFVLPGGQWTTPLRYEGDLYRATGPQYNAPAFDAARVRVVKVGTFAIDFSGRDAGTFTYIVDGVQVSRPISRQPF
jgi:hypothetical protein